ncbi:MAG: ParB/RepB/Spo0J family partition protein [Anaerolineae bacterium]|nr:ParB/RepB/Spo0J family partition protein [Anaerolineae bacterium]MCX8068418.1 ParB/RepB/Spo0J family partition protein [Anaerolineae bacterium]MDW7991546.1 ParB/RepB/Spo0J family partition protein [Anaerolineae bacterium]
MPGKFGLGRGLEALIPVPEETAGVLEVPVDAIRPNPHQPRMAIHEHELVELALSIQTHGVLQPLIVTREGDGYQLVAGERRWRAAKLAGLATVPVILKDLAPQQVLELALVENLQRKDLNPLEEANAYRQLIEEFGLTHEEVARRVGKSRVAITNTLRLLKATDAVKEALLNGRITEGHARALLALEDPQVQVAALRTVLRQGLNVRQTEELVGRMLEHARPRRAAPAIPPEVRALESRLQQALGTRVRLRPGRKGGRLVIYYYSDEDLEALYLRLVGGTA